MVRLGNDQHQDSALRKFICAEGILNGILPRCFDVDVKVIMRRQAAKSNSASARINVRRDEFYSAPVLQR